VKLAEKWAPSGIRAILHRELYRGVLVYGQTRWDRSRGPKRKVRVPASEWVRKERPDLRIVSEDLWQRAHARMKASHAAYLRRNSGQLHGKPLAGLAGKYRLSGLLRCGSCGSTLQLSKSSGTRGKTTTNYVCSGRKARPGAGCEFERGVPEGILADAIINALREEFLDSELLQDRIHEMRARWESAPDHHDEERRAHVDRIATLDAELGRLINLVVSGKAPETVVRAIEEREAEKRTTRAALDRLDVMARNRRPVDAEQLQEALENFVDALVYDLGESPAKVQQTLGRLLTRPIVVHRQPDGWRAILEASFDKLGGDRANVTAELAVGNVWCPRGDSNTRHAV
jgi:site-specific DNA recombinase